MRIANEGATAMLRELKARMDKRRQERRAARPERMEKKARAEAQRREHQRESMDSKIHRK